MDALGWPLVQRHGFLRALLPHRRPLRTTLGYSSGAIPTILTGEPPSRHGHWNLFYFDPFNSPFRWVRPLAGGPTRLLDHRYGRALITRLGRHLLGLGPGFECALAPGLLPWFNFCEPRHLYAPGSIAGAVSAFDLWQAAGLRHRIYSYRDGDDFELIRRARRALAQGEATTVFVYLSGLDGFLHQHLGEAAAVSAELDRYAAALAELHATMLARDPDARFRLFSDHGMAPVTARVDLAQALHANACRVPDDYLAVYDSTMLRCWFWNPRARDSITATVRRLDCGRVLEEHELRELGVWFDDQRFGQLIFLLNPGVLVSQGDFNGRGWNPCGMHGYHPDDPDSDAVILSNHDTDTEMSEIAHLFGCLCEPLAQGAHA